MEIIRNCSHYSPLQVGFELDGRGAPIKVVKTAFDEEGTRLIKNEFNGVSWYSESMKCADNSILSFTNHQDKSARLELPYRAGQSANLKLPLRKNFKKIQNALTHYCDLFRNKGGSFSHGDYSIDNILFAKDQVSWVLDWENFNDKLPLEFDVVYCVMEASYFAYKKQGGFITDEANAAVALLKYGLEKLALPSGSIMKAPASHMRRLFMGHAFVFGAQIAKYPLAICPEEDIKIIDAAISKSLCL